MSEESQIESAVEAAPKSFQDYLAVLDISYKSRLFIQGLSQDYLQHFILNSLLLLIFLGNLDIKDHLCKRQFTIEQKQFSDDCQEMDKLISKLEINPQFEDIQQFYEWIVYRILCNQKLQELDIAVDYVITALLQYATMKYENGKKLYLLSILKILVIDYPQLQSDSSFLIQLATSDLIQTLPNNLFPDQVTFFNTLGIHNGCFFMQVEISSISLALMDSIIWTSPEGFNAVMEGFEQQQAIYAGSSKLSVLAELLTKTKSSILCTNILGFLKSLCTAHARHFQNNSIIDEIQAAGIFNILSTDIFDRIKQGIFEIEGTSFSKEDYYGVPAEELFFIADYKRRQQTTIYFYNKETDFNEFQSSLIPLFMQIYELELKHVERFKERSSLIQSEQSLRNESSFISKDTASKSDSTSPDKQFIRKNNIGKEKQEEKNQLWLEKQKNQKLEKEVEKLQEKINNQEKLQQQVQKSQILQAKQAQKEGQELEKQSLKLKEEEIAQLKQEKLALTSYANEQERIRVRLESELNNYKSEKELNQQKMSQIKENKQDNLLERNKQLTTELLEQQELKNKREKEIASLTLNLTAIKTKQAATEDNLKSAIEEKSFLLEKLAKVEKLCKTQDNQLSMDSIIKLIQGQSVQEINELKLANSILLAKHNSSGIYNAAQGQNGLEIPQAPILSGIPAAPVLTGIPIAPIISGIPAAPTLSGIPIAPILDIPQAPSLSGIGIPQAPCLVGIGVIPSAPVLHGMGIPEAPRINDLGIPQPPPLSGMGIPQAPSLPGMGIPQPPPLLGMGVIPSAPSLTGIGIPQAPNLSGIGIPQAPSFVGTGAPPAPSLSGMGIPSAPSLTGMGIPQAPVFNDSGVPSAPKISGFGTPAAPSINGIPFAPSLQPSGVPPIPSLIPPPNIISNPSIVKAKKNPGIPMKGVNWQVLKYADIQGSLWEKVKEEEIVLEEDYLKQQFCQKATIVKQPNPAASSSVAEIAKKVLLLTPERQQNILLILGKIKMKGDAVAELLLQCDSPKINSNLITSLLSSMPTEQEIAAISSFDGKIENLGDAEKYIKALENTNGYEERLLALKFKFSYPESKDFLQEKIILLNKFFDSVESDKTIVKILEHALALGNFVNGTGFKGGAWGFKFSNIDKLAEVKSFDNKLNLLMYLINRAEQLEGVELVNLGEDLKYLEECTKIPISYLVSELTEVKRGIKAIDKAIKMQSDNPLDKIRDSVEPFSMTIQPEVEQFDQQIKDLDKRYKGIAEFFSEDPKKLSSEEFAKQVLMFKRACIQAKVGFKSLKR